MIYFSDLNPTELYLQIWNLQTFMDKYLRNLK